MSNVCKIISAAAVLAASALLATAAAPPGWLLAGNKPDNYETGVDRQAIYNKLPSAFLKAKADEEGFGTLMQQFSADQYRGKRLRLSAFVKSDNVARWAGLWMRIDGKDPATGHLGFDNMQDRGIKGTTAWQRYDVVLDVPENAAGIALGILLAGPGEVWLNNVKIEVVGNDVPVTGFPKSPAEGPRNLSFDQ
jgi:hypothetical protein